tara:strand:+ start:315 stop:1073 length:759 start_codon:yes stop_codon:yes gene_type:complete
MRYRLITFLLAPFFMLPLLANALDMKDKDLLLYFSANELNGDLVKDLSKNKNDGKVEGKVKLSNDGKFGKALEFAAGGEIKAPYIPLNEKSFTICLWVNPQLKGGDQQCVVSQTDVNASNTSLHYRIYNSGTVRMGFYGNDLDAPTAVKAGKWAHICFWLDVKKKKRRVYIDGKQLVEDAGKAGINYLGKKGDTMIGSWGATGQKFNGLIDEVQIWDRALSEKDIKASMDELAAAPVEPMDKLAKIWGKLKH